MTGGERLAADTSVAIPYLMASHPAHAHVRASLAGIDLVLTGQSLTETYSVLTRLPGDARVSARDAVRLIDANFGDAVLPEPPAAASVHRILAEAGIAGGAAYDGLVALAAAQHRLDLVTRDARALGTYAGIGAAVRLLAP